MKFNHDNKLIAKNIFALFFLQFSNYIVPLLVLPFLTRVLGVDRFGEYVYVFSLCNIFIILVDYGFSVSGAYFVARNKNNKSIISEYIGGVFGLKIILVFVVSILSNMFIVFHFGMDFFYHNLKLITSVNIVVLSNTLFPSWFFQGIEKVKRTTTYAFVSKVMYLLFVVILVNKNSSVEKILFLYSVSNIVANAIAFRYIYIEGYSIQFPSFTYIYTLLIKGVGFWLSRVAVGIYTSASTFLVGSFTTMAQAGLYSSSEKIYQAGQSVTSPISQALYPYLARTGDIRRLYVFVFLLLIPMILTCSILFLFSENILVYLYGDGFARGSSVLRVFLICLSINFLSVNFGYPAFSAINKINVANYTIFMGTAVYVIYILFMLLNNALSATVISIGVLLSESIVLLVRLFLFFFYRIKR